MFRIAVLDDDQMTLDFLKSILSQDYDVILFNNANDFLNFLKTEKVDLLLIDNAMPDVDGKQVCASLRNIEDYYDIPIMIVSGKTEEMDIIAALYVGADDYIFKPINPTQLRARIHSRLRTKKQMNNILYVKELEIHTDTHKVYMFKSNIKQEIELTKSEFNLLLLLVSNSNNILTRNEIIKSLWPDKEKTNNRTVDTHVSNLRKKLKEAQIQIDSVHGEGYVLNAA